MSFLALDFSTKKILSARGPKKLPTPDIDYTLQVENQIDLYVLTLHLWTILDCKMFSNYFFNRSKSSLKHRRKSLELQSCCESPWFEKTGFLSCFATQPNECEGSFINGDKVLLSKRHRFFLNRLSQDFKIKKINLICYANKSRSLSNVVRYNRKVRH